eukprot:jgi/Tetstr1/437762/TSEL_026416.t1
MAEAPTAAKPAASSLSKAFKQTKCLVTLGGGVRAAGALQDASGALNDRKRSYFSKDRSSVCVGAADRPWKVPRPDAGADSALDIHRRAAPRGEGGVEAEDVPPHKRNGGAEAELAGEAIGASTQLPPQYSKLAQIYDALLVAQAIFLSRRTCCTLERLTKAAENQLGFAVQLAHLQQIKHVYPEGLEWSWVESSTALRSATGSAPRRRTLKLVLGPAASAPGTGSAPVMRRHSPALQSGPMKASTAQLRVRLAAAAAAAGAGVQEQAGALPELPLAALPPVGSYVSSDSDFVRLGSNQPVVAVAPGASILCSRSSVPDAPADDAEDADAGGKVRVASHKRRVTFGGAVEYLIPPRRPRRRLIDDTDSEDESGDEGGEIIRPLPVAEPAMALIDPEKDSSTPSSDDSSTSSEDTSSEDCERLGICMLPKPACSSAPKAEAPPQAETNHAGADLSGLSEETLQLLDAMEAADAAADPVADAAAAAKRRAAQALPRTFDMLQGLFGSSGPCGMPREQAISRLQTTASRRIPTSATEVAQMLQALAEAAPHYLQLLSAEETASKRATVRINRQQDMRALRRKLLTAAEAAKTC